jgi:peptidoglycan/LPS O-acetylase OafA/YrhL
MTPDTANPAGTQFGFIDLFKAIAAQLIVLHHLAFYGPMADHARSVLPALIDWLDFHARIAVQVFLVISGFLAAKSLCPQGTPRISNPLGIVVRRYTKLVPPFLAATVFTIAASGWAAQWMSHDSISTPPTLLELTAHAFLLHSVLGYESVSAGAWYVAIDFQLYASMTFLLWLSGRLFAHRWLPWMLPLAVVACISASLLHFNRDPDWDVWAPYFFGSYGLGVMAWWASDPARRPAIASLLLAAIMLPAMAALTIDFRSRIALAVVVACALVAVGRRRLFQPGRRSSFVGWLGRISYSVFLTHFPVCLVVNAAFTRFVPAQPLLQAAGMLLAWAASVAAGAAFYRWVERPLNRLHVPARLGALASTPQ